MRFPFARRLATARENDRRASATSPCSPGGESEKPAPPPPRLVVVRPGEAQGLPGVLHRPLGSPCACAIEARYTAIVAGSVRISSPSPHCARSASVTDPRTSSALTNRSSAPSKSPASIRPYPANTVRTAFPLTVLSGSLVNQASRTPSCRSRRIAGASASMRRAARSKRSPARACSMASKGSPCSSYQRSRGRAGPAASWAARRGGVRAARRRRGGGSGTSRGGRRAGRRTGSRDPAPPAVARRRRGRRDRVAQRAAQPVRGWRSAAGSPAPAPAAGASTSSTR